MSSLFNNCFRYSSILLIKFSNEVLMADFIYLIITKYPFEWLYLIFHFFRDTVFTIQNLIHHLWKIFIRFFKNFDHSNKILLKILIKTNKLMTWMLKHFFCIYENSFTRLTVQLYGFWLIHFFIIIKINKFNILNN